GNRRVVVGRRCGIAFGVFGMRCVVGMGGILLRVLLVMMLIMGGFGRGVFSRRLGRDRLRPRRDRHARHGFHSRSRFARGIRRGRSGLHLMVVMVVRMIMVVTMGVVVTMRIVVMPIVIVTGRILVMHSIMLMMFCIVRMDFASVGTVVKV